MAGFRERRDPPPRHDRRGLARHRHRGPVPRLHLLDARLARAVHPPRRAHRAGRARAAAPISLISAMDLMNFNRLVKRYHVEVKEIAGPDRRGGRRSARSSASSTPLAEAGQQLPLDDFARPRADRARGSPTHELRDRIVALAAQGPPRRAWPRSADEDDEPAAPGTASGGSSYGGGRGGDGSRRPPPAPLRPRELAPVVAIDEEPEATDAAPPRRHAVSGHRIGADDEEARSGGIQGGNHIHEVLQGFRRLRLPGPRRSGRGLRPTRTGAAGGRRGGAVAAATSSGDGGRNGQGVRAAVATRRRSQRSKNQLASLQPSPSRAR